MDDSKRIPSNEEVVDYVIGEYLPRCPFHPDRELPPPGFKVPEHYRKHGFPPGVKIPTAEEYRVPPEGAESVYPASEGALKDAESPPDYTRYRDPDDRSDGSDDSLPDKCTCGIDNIEQKRKPEKESKPEDYIDEEELKAKEQTYSPDDLERLRAEADELKVKGNIHFKNLAFIDAAYSYTTALRTCPLAFTKERAILYANRAAAKIKLEREQDAIEDCTKALELEPNYMKALIRRAQQYEKSDKLEEALEDYKKIVELDSSNREAVEACRRLPSAIHEKNEKLKAEMIDKLKDLGNLFLRPFGLSTDSFQMTQDPKTGGYSVSLKK